MDQHHRRCSCQQSSNTSKSLAGYLRSCGPNNSTYRSRWDWNRLTHTSKRQQTLHLVYPISLFMLNSMCSIDPFVLSMHLFQSMTGTGWFRPTRQRFSSADFGCEPMQRHQPKTSTWFYHVLPIDFQRFGDKCPVSQCVRISVLPWVTSEA